MIKEYFLSLYVLILLTFVFNTEQIASAINTHDDFSFPKGNYNSVRFDALNYDRN